MFFYLLLLLFVKLTWIYKKIKNSYPIFFPVHLQATSQTIPRRNNRMHLYIIIACFLALFLLLASVSSSDIFVFPQHWFLKAGVRNWRIWPLKSVFQRPLRPTMTRKRYLTYDLSASAGFHLLYWASQMTETLSDAQMMFTDKWSGSELKLLVWSVQCSVPQ